MSVLERVKTHEAVALGVVGEEATNRSDYRRLREDLRHELVGRLGLSAIASMLQSVKASEVREELAVTCQAILNEAHFSSLLQSEQDQVTREVLDDICGLGPIQSLLDDDGVSEIMINGTGALFFERDGRIHSAESVFESKEQIMMVIDRILAPLGRRLDRTNPLVDARLANGDRVNAVSDTIAINGPAVTIRKFSDRITTLDRLVELGSIPGWYATLLSWAVHARQDIAVAGGTGSGKTTLLNALSTQIGLQERIVTIEDSAELKFDSHPDVVRLEARSASIEGTGEVTIRDLVKNALRMRPDRIVVGECRGEETIDMLQAMNTGHDGSLTTLHAGSAQEAILRLVLMARFGMDLPTDIIEEQIASALDLLVMSARFPDGIRRITSLSEVSRADSGGVMLRECVRYDQARGTWELVSEPSFIGEAIRIGALRTEEVERWRRCMPSLAA
ncbi:CpaF family protein [Parafannyhessea umbonata]|jgi:pilus assembly protein CpaF|uniref:CpaF family protein n=1 Tax=Parafannyhessea umbonata TaxID=604330 RepID=A0A6N7X932_9ACTN|nr:CpaF family protein [Parafannyhessea umbonata]MCI6682654.1 CpaF family protein [Parafannyhessea umbonata]MDD6358710.1 CpaF family protein [Parafannyhessea umbonata]MDD7200036.1 CpaF family protein [Parafannyhessea umbonata]MDY4015649.1 CpaF family protein [Parafannyhessea umbonata]MST59717.1 CpaF family protein [Parafannyhessea umbonata]